MQPAPMNTTEAVVAFRSIKAAPEQMGKPAEPKGKTLTETASFI